MKSDCKLFIGHKPEMNAYNYFPNPPLRERVLREERYREELRVVLLELFLCEEKRLDELEERLTLLLTFCLKEDGLLPQVLLFPDADFE